MRPEKSTKPRGEHAYARMEEHAKTCLSGSIEEVILDVAHDGLVSVFQCSHLRALACAREVGLQGTCTAVRNRNLVRMIRPHWHTASVPFMTLLVVCNVRTFAEVFQKVLVAIDFFVLVQNAERAQLSVQRPLCESSLRDVCAVKIVHAVRADSALL